MATKTPKTTTNDTPEAALANVVGAQNPDGSAVVAQAGTVAQEALQAAAPAVGGFVPKIAKILTLPLLKLQEGIPAYVKFTGKTFIGKQIDEGNNPDGTKKAKKEPPVMANVINLATGELVQIMLGSVLVGILRDEYPEDSYVSKGFVLQLTEKKRGRNGGNYNTYKVAELDLS